MGENVNKFLSKGLWVSIALFVIRCLIFEPVSAYDYFGASGEAIAVTLIVMGVYNVFLWKYNPFEKAPRLMGNYSGRIEYSFNGKAEIKDVNVVINQTVLALKVKIVTDEITSNTISSNLIKENDDYVLYYTYITNPKSKYCKGNPVQYGTCRLTEQGEFELYGTYWTSRQTIGDIVLKKQT